MKDRLACETVRLKNGITIYAKQWDVPFADVRLCFPLGHLHNTGDIPPGTAHYLEHLVCKRSEAFPENDGFGGMCSERGGSFNASTSRTWTEYRLTTPADTFPELFPAFVRHILSPALNEDDIRNESSVISSERMRVSRWNPGDTKAEQHQLLNWMHEEVPVRQRFGETEDHERLTPQVLRALHDAYLDPRAFLCIGGTFDLDLVCKALEVVPTRRHNLGMEYEQVVWSNRTYHEAPCLDSTRCIYMLGGIVPERDPRTRCGMNLLGQMLVNRPDGTLFSWLRRDLGWSYNMGFEFTTKRLPFHHRWELWLPVQEKKQAQHVRSDLHGKILMTTRDTHRIREEMRRQVLKSVYWYQTISSVLNSIAQDVYLYGQAYTEHDWREFATDAANPTFLQHLYDAYWSPDVSGEFLALPDVA